MHVFKCIFILRYLIFLLYYFISGFILSVVLFCMCCSRHNTKKIFLFTYPSIHPSITWPSVCHMYMHCIHPSIHPSHTTITHASIHRIHKMLFIWSFIALSLLCCHNLVAKLNNIGLDTNTHLKFEPWLKSPDLDICWYSTHVFLRKALKQSILRGLSLQLVNFKWLLKSGQIASKLPLI